MVHRAPWAGWRRAADSWRLNCWSRRGRARSWRSLKTPSLRRYSSIGLLSSLQQTSHAFLQMNQELCSTSCSAGGADSQLTQNWQCHWLLQVTRAAIGCFKSAGLPLAASSQPGCRRCMKSNAPCLSVNFTYCLNQGHRFVFRCGWDSLLNDWGCSHYGLNMFLTVRGTDLPFSKSGLDMSHLCEMKATALPLDLTTVLLQQGRHPGPQELTHASKHNKTRWHHKDGSVTTVASAGSGMTESRTQRSGTI